MYVFIYTEHIKNIEPVKYLENEAFEKIMLYTLSCRVSTDASNDEIYTFGH